MIKETELAEGLKDAGCDREDINIIISLYLQRDIKGMEKMIGKCRRQQLTKMHDSQSCIDRLDYLEYQIGRE